MMEYLAPALLVITVLGIVAYLFFSRDHPTETQKPKIGSMADYEPAVRRPVEKEQLYRWNDEAHDYLPVDD